MFMANTPDNIYAVPLHPFFTATPGDDVQTPIQTPKPVAGDPAPAANADGVVAGENDPANADAPKQSNGFGGFGGRTVDATQPPPVAADALLFKNDQHPTRPRNTFRGEKDDEGDDEHGSGGRSDEVHDEQSSTIKSQSSIIRGTDPTFVFFSEEFFSTEAMQYYGEVQNPVVEKYKMFTQTFKKTVDDMYCNGNIDKNMFREFFILLFAQMFKLFSTKQYSSHAKDFNSQLIPIYICHIGAEWLPSLNSFSVYIDEDKNTLQLDLQLVDDTRLTFYVFEHTPNFIVKKHDETKSGNCLHVTFKLRTSKDASKLSKLEQSIIGMCNAQKTWFETANKQTETGEVNFSDPQMQHEFSLFLDLQTAGCCENFNPRVYEMEMDLKADFGFWANIAKDMYLRNRHKDWEGLHQSAHEDNHKHEFTHLVKALGKYVFKVQFRDGAAIRYNLPGNPRTKLVFHHTNSTTHKPTYTDPHTWALTIDDECSKIVYKGHQLPDNTNKTKRKNLKSEEN